MLLTVLWLVGWLTSSGHAGARASDPLPPANNGNTPSLWLACCTAPPIAWWQAWRTDCPCGATCGGRSRRRSTGCAAALHLADRTAPHLTLRAATRADHGCTERPEDENRHGHRAAGRDRPGARVVLEGEAGEQQPLTMQPSRATTAPTRPPQPSLSPPRPRSSGAAARAAGRDVQGDRVGRGGPGDDPDAGRELG